MLKQKYLHRKSRSSGSDGYWKRRYNRHYTDLFSDLPKHESIRKNFRYSNYDSTPLFEFLNSKIGEDWNDIYSEILKKIKKRYRSNMDYSIKWYVHIPIYDEDFIPRDNRGRMLNEILFIDMNNILSYKTKEDILIESKKLKRKEKLRKILENLENQEKENKN
jgi:hypothetical protein